ncbi:MAG: 2-oxoglutarate dehydrogenase complex dihydrolipoyllysine-residue succinyltransferase [Pirellulaceae bacterium]|nr:2-oxoglutarate dehydrogenase complex dihydrolipoyllysine-residue succinyltransferase [Pirellulaceae bacterium]
MVEVKVPSVGESISEVQISQWLKKEGDYVDSGTDLVDLETEKASVQVPAPFSGILIKIVKNKDEFATVGETLCMMEPSERGMSTPPPVAADIEPAAATTESNTSPKSSPSPDTTRVMPAAARMLADSHLTPDQVPASGPGGRLLKEDVAKFVAAKEASPIDVRKPIAPKQTPVLEIDRSSSESTQLSNQPSGNRVEEIKPMSMIRRTIATRLVQAQHSAALLTTFNEVDMQPVMGLRTKYRDAFQEKHGVKLGFMSFFAKAACEGLKRFPLVNAELRGNNIVIRHYCDIGIAIGGGKGLVVPILRNVEKMSFAEVERSIGEYSRKAMENKLTPEELSGGTFTISNGGVYGSLLSTPIVNPPQSGILGLHSIQDRPIALNGEVVIRPMMYLALTYDHRIVDGREAVTFLRTIKEVIEDPTRLFLEV